MVAVGFVNMAMSCIGVKTAVAMEYVNIRYKNDFANNVVVELFVSMERLNTVA